jgi:hypothetical protein
MRDAHAATHCCRGTWSATPLDRAEHRTQHRRAGPSDPPRMPAGAALARRIVGTGRHGARAADPPRSREQHEYGHREDGSPELSYSKRPPDRPVRAPRQAIDEQRGGGADHDQEHEEPRERGAVSCVVVLRRVAVGRLSPDN